MLKFFRIPFANSGDKAAIPDAADVNGYVSYTEGWPFDYQRQKTDPAAKNIERDKMNELFFDVTKAISELQSQGIPDFITSALNGGTAYSYNKGALVTYNKVVYQSQVDSNTSDPTDTTKWSPLLSPSQIQGNVFSSAYVTGTANALAAAFSPTITALPTAPGTLSVLVRAGLANTGAATFAADGLTAKSIVKGNNLPIVAGDIAGPGHWLQLDYDASLDKWVLLNPAKGVSIAVEPATTTTAGVARYATGAEAAAGTVADATLTPSTLRSGLNATGSAPIYACRAWILMDCTGGAPVINGSGNVSSVTKNATGNYTANFTTAMPDANYSAVGSCNAQGGQAYVVCPNSDGYTPFAPTASACRFTTSYAGNVADIKHVSLTIFR